MGAGDRVHAIEPIGGGPQQASLAARLNRRSASAGATSHTLQAFHTLHALHVERVQSMSVGAEFWGLERPIVNIMH
jgi:hypothetical protein